jgi:hypothetical protein
MTRKEYWDLFKETGKIEYYLEYKKLTMEDDLDDKEDRGHYSK